MPDTGRPTHVAESGGGHRARLARGPHAVNMFFSENSTVQSPCPPCAEQEDTGKPWECPRIYADTESGRTNQKLMGMDPSTLLTLSHVVFHVL